MAKWATEEWVASKEDDAKSVERILIRLRRVANLIKTDAICRSRPNVRDRASEMESLISLLEKKLDE
mgnify:CR=1 FL=1|tara:strand:- start:360 stop:560 length:201 start_codon:yes stop_codon:yes gene_type:complete